LALCPRFFVITLSGPRKLLFPVRGSTVQLTELFLCARYRGEPLLTFLDQMPLLDRKTNAPLMVPISEKYSDMGCVVVGKLESGKVRKNQDLLLMPNKTPVQATAIYNEMEEEVPLALSGDNVRIRLRGVEDTDINVGFMLTDPKKPVKAVTQFEAQLVIL
jgi:peptide chain release factor subunit 3